MLEPKAVLQKYFKSMTKISHSTIRKTN